MEKQYAPSANEKKHIKASEQPAKPVESNTKSEKAEAKKEISTEVAKEKTEHKPVISKKDFAVARADSARVSKKHAMYIGNFIKGKSIEQSITELEEVVKLKRTIPMKGEIPHRKGNMMSGRYPVDTAKIFISTLKGLKGNVIVNGMDLSRTRIVSTVSNWASRPARGGGIRAKRAHIIITARENKETKK